VYISGFCGIVERQLQHYGKFKKESVSKFA
jgi:hypothetical protein